MTSSHHAARRGNPLTSHAAVRNRALKWDSMNAIALRIYYDHREWPAGLTYWEVELIAPPRALGKSPWKRCGELHTEYDPVLIAPVLDSFGNELVRPGEFGDPVGAYRITDAGIYMYWKTRPQP